MKEKIFATAKYLIYIAALSHLALSQMHIDIITKVFEPTAGFLLFLFTIFGVVLAASTSSVQKGSRIEIFILGCTVAVIMGILYLRVIFQDIQAENLLTFDDVKLSVTVIISTLAVYVLGTATMLITGRLEDD